MTIAPPDLSAVRAWPFEEARKVAARLTKFINEKTGKMIHPKNDVIILENAVCHSRYVDNCRLFCPRRMYLYFREIWLERVPGPLSVHGEDGRVASARAD